MMPFIPLIRLSLASAVIMTMPALMTSTVLAQGKCHKLCDESAAKTYSPKQIRQFLKQGETVDSLGKNQSTPLHWIASDNPNPKATASLLKAGANPNIKDAYGSTPLVWAAGYNLNPQVLQLLLKAGADINTAADNGSGPLHAAALMNQNPTIPA